MKEKLILAIEIFIIESLFFFAFSGVLRLLRDEIWNFFFNLALISLAFTVMTCMYYLFFTLYTNQVDNIPQKRISSLKRKRNSGLHR